MRSDRSEKPVLIIAYKHWSTDPRIQREIGALVDNGYMVDYICTRMSSEPKPSMRGVRIYSFPIHKKRGGVLRYMTEYATFCLFVFIMTNCLYLRNRYKLIIPFVMPEFLVLNCVIPKIFGAKILTDWEDPSREVFLAKFRNGEKSFFFKLISLFEKLSVMVADEIITPNEGFRKAFVKRGYDAGKIHIIMNAPDPTIFFDDAEEHCFPDDGTFVILYSGSIVRRHGLDVMIKAMPLIVQEIPGARLKVLVGQEEYLSECRNLCSELGMEKHVEFADGVYISKIPDIIKSCAAGVVPNRKDAFTMINFPQRILEFALLKRPAVVPKLPGIEDYVDESSVVFFEPGNHADLASKIIDLHRSPEKWQSIVRSAHAVVKKLEWRQPFLDIVERLCR